MRRTIILILGAALFGIFAAVVFASQGSDDPAGSTTAETVTETVERTTTVPKKRAQTGVDISGPCDEAEHANDPRCAGQAPAAPPAQAPAQAPAQGGVDISGPCDEAEHANDPRCTGAAVDPDDDDRLDNSGPGSVNSGHDDDFDDDHGGDDDGFDDDHGGNSGHGGGGDDDNSGHGGGDDD